MSEPVFPWNEIEKLKEESSSKSAFYETMRYKLNDAINDLEMGSEKGWEDFQVTINALLDMVFENLEGSD